MDSENNDLENSAKSESSSHMIIISKPSKNCVCESLSNDKKGTSNNNTIHGSCHLESRGILPSVVPSPTPEALARDSSEERRLYRERIPQRTNSNPNFSSMTRTQPNDFHPALRLRLGPVSPQSALERKHEDDMMNDFTPALSSVVNRGFRTEPTNDFRNSSSPPEVQSSGVSRLFSRLTSLITSRTLDSLDESVLNNFNLQVGTVASRIDMWRQRLEDERSVMSDSRSVDIGSSSRSTPVTQPPTFITDEIHRLLQLVKGLANSVFGRFSWGFLGMEDRLMVLLEMGSHMVYPAAEILMMNIWRLLREILDLHDTDIEKSGRMHSVVEALNNALNAIRSLIQLGNAYRNAHERSDSEYTGEDSRSLLERSLASLDIKHSDI